MADGKALRDVLDAIREYGLSAQVVRVGDIVLQLSKPWPVSVATEKEKPTTEEQAIAAEMAPHKKQQERLEMLRLAFRKQFGRASVNDNELELLAPELLRGMA